MTKKYFHKKVNLVHDISINDQIKPVCIEYYLLESIENDIEELRGETVYGIEIVKKTEGGDEERKDCKNLMFCREETQILLGKFADNMVLPDELPYIIDDMLGISI